MERAGWTRAVSWVGLVALASCDEAPAQDLLGSFFPAWMLCAVAGVAAAVAGRRLLVAIGIDAHVPAAPLTWVAFAACVTLLVWLIWFGH